MLRILLVEDQEDDAELTVRALKRGGLQFDWERVDTESGFRQALARRPDLVLSDGQLPGFGGLAALVIMRSERLEIPFILLSGAPWDHRAQEAIAAGASAFVCKADLGALMPAVERALANPRPS